MLKMNVKDMNSQVENKATFQPDSDVDASYIKGIFDAIRYVGGDLTEAFDKKQGLSPVNTNEILQTIRTFSNSLQKQTENSQIQTDLFVNQPSYMRQSEQLRAVRNEVMDKKEEISLLRSELERKNIMLSLKDNENRQLTLDASWMADTNWNNSSALRTELRETRKKLDEKQTEVNMMRRELEQRNILLSTMKTKISQFH